MSVCADSIWARHVDTSRCHLLIVQVRHETGGVERREYDSSPNTENGEIWVIDPDGYLVVFAEHYGDR